MISCLKAFMINNFSHDFLSQFRWYRHWFGGWWLHSKVLGWESITEDRAINRELELFKTKPELYNQGRDIENHTK